jgi:RND family efflux transporter MFP subunit
MLFRMTPFRIDLLTRCIALLRRRLGGFGGAAVVALALPLGGCDDAARAFAAKPVPVRVEQVHLTPRQQLSRYAASIKPRVEADLGFRVGGKMIARLVDVGAVVSAGTELARLDPDDLNLQVQAVAAQLVSARADAANAKRDFDRSTELRRSQWTTQQDHDRRWAAAATAQARADQLEAQLRVARNSAHYTTLIADGPGVVTAVLVEPGQVVAQGQSVFKVARLGEMEAEANVPEQRLETLRQAGLTLEVWSLPGVSVRAKLREVSPSADPVTRTYKVRASLADPPPQLQLGMTATLIAKAHGEGTAAILPLTALTKDGGQPAVFVVDAAGDSLELRPVEVASYAGDRVILQAGVREGEKVVTAGVHKLDAAQKVRIWLEPDR